MNESPLSYPNDIAYIERKEIGLDVLYFVFLIYESTTKKSIILQDEKKLIKCCVNHF